MCSQECPRAGVELLHQQMLCRDQELLPYAKQSRARAINDATRCSKRRRLSHDTATSWCYSPTRGEESAETDSPAAGAGPSGRQHDDDITHWRLQEERMYPAAAQLWSRQDEVTPHMRLVLIRWLLDVCRQYRLTRETFLLTVNYLDRYLACRRVSRRLFQLLGVACLWVAGKYEEVRAPTAQQLLHMTHNAYSVKQLCRMEGDLLAALGFELGAPTALKFLDWLLATEPLQLGAAPFASTSLPTAAVAALPAAPNRPAARGQPGARGECGAGPGARDRGCCAEIAALRQLALQLLDMSVLAVHFGPVLPAAPAPAPTHTPASVPAPSPAPVATPTKVRPPAACTPSCMAPCTPERMPSLDQTSCSDDDATTPLYPPASRPACARPSAPSPASTSPSSHDSASASTMYPSPSSSDPDSESASASTSPAGPSTLHAEMQQQHAPMPARPRAALPRGVGSPVSALTHQHPASHVAAACVLAAKSMRQNLSRASVDALAVRAGCQPTQLLMVAQALCELASSSPRV